MPLEGYCTNCSKCRNRRTPSPLFEIYFEQRSAALRISGNYGEWVKKNCAEGAPPRADGQVNETPQLPPPQVFPRLSESSPQRSQQQTSASPPFSSSSGLNADRDRLIPLIPSIVVTMPEEETSELCGPSSDQTGFASSSKTDLESAIDYECEYLQTQLKHRAQTTLANLNCLALRRAICRLEEYGEGSWPSRSEAVNLVDQLCMIHLDAVEEDFVLDIEPNGSDIDKLLQRLDKLAVERCKFVVSEGANGKEYSSGDVTCLAAALEREHLQEIIFLRDQHGVKSYVKQALSHFGIGHSAEEIIHGNDSRGMGEVTFDPTKTNTDAECTAGTTYGVTRVAAIGKDMLSPNLGGQLSSPAKRTSGDSSPNNAGSISPGSLTAWEQSLLRGSPTREELEAVTQANARDSEERAMAKGKSVEEEPQTREPAFASSEDFNRRALAFPLGVGQCPAESPSVASDMASASPMTKYWQEKRMVKYAREREASHTDSMYTESVYSVRQSDPCAKASVLLRNVRENTATSVASSARAKPVKARSPPSSLTLNVQASQNTKSQRQARGITDSRLDALPDLGHKVTKVSKDGEIDEMFFVPDVERIGQLDAYERMIAWKYEAKMAEREHEIACHIQFMNDMHAKQAEDLATLKSIIAEMQEQNLIARERRAAKKAAKAEKAAAATAAANIPVALDVRDGEFYLLPTVFEGMENYLRRLAEKEK